MKKLMIVALLFVGITAYGFKRDCQPSSSTDYTYSLTVLSAQDGATMCRVSLSVGEKEFIRQALARFSDNTLITRAFYVDSIKNQYSADNNLNNAIRRVVRDFGGSKKDSSVSRTVGDIRSMLNGKLKDIGTEGDAF